MLSLTFRALIPLLGLLTFSAFQSTETDPIGALPPATTRVLEDGRRMVIEVPPVHVPAATSEGEAMVRTPVYRVDVPQSGAIYGYTVEVVDGSGTVLPRSALHHVNLNDPSRRELFSPIELHILAASRETPTPSVPWLLFGLPLKEGQRLIVSGMVANSQATPLHDVRIRITLELVPPNRPWPLWDVYPWAMDVKHPLGGAGGSMAFDLPPGRSEQSWESSPAIPGSIIGMGGHVHDYAVRLEFRDVTANEVLWEVTPKRDAGGRVVELPFGRFYRFYRLGKHIQPDHRYRVTVFYDNPTGHVIVDGGMGAVAGAFVPDRGAPWPQVDPADPIFQQGLGNTLANTGSGVMHGHHH